MTNLTAGTLVLHLETLTIGRVARVLPPGEHRGLDGEAVDEEVVELADGNRFLAREGAFVELSDVEVALVDQVEQELRTLLTGTAFLLHRVTVPQARAVLLCRAALSRQLRALATQGDLPADAAG